MSKVFEDLYRKAKTPAQVNTITAIVIGLAVIASLGLLVCYGGLSCW